MLSNLGCIANYVNDKINVCELDRTTYISTENMLPNRSGIVTASNLPNINLTTAFKAGDVLVSNIRPYFKKIWYATFDGGCSNDVLVFRVKDGFDSRFLYYVLSEDKFFDYSMSTSKGTKMPRGDKKSILEYNVPNLDIETQKKIAKVLSALDDKIELNNSINSNLEEQAQALYYKLVKDKINNGTLNDIIEEQPKSKIKVSDAKDIKGLYPFFTSGQSILEYNEFLVNGRNIYLNTGGNADVKYYIGPAAYSTDTWCINAKNNLTDMLYLLLKSMLKELNEIYFEGSALKHLQKQKLKELEIYIPNNDEILKFNSVVVPLFNTISINTQENKQLSLLRNILLPKLMSGEVDVETVCVSEML